MWNNLRQFLKVAVRPSAITNVSQVPMPVLASVNQNRLMSTSGLLSLSPTSLAPATRITSSASAIFGPTLSAMPLLTQPTGMFGGLVVTPSRGMKIKGRLKRRCKDCYLIYINGVLHNLCKTHGRHKAHLKEKYFANQRLMAHATMGINKPWEKPRYLRKHIF